MAKFRTEDIVSGGFVVSGSWATISGTYIEVMRQLSSEVIPGHKVVSIVFESASNKFVAFVHKGAGSED